MSDARPGWSFVRSPRWLRFAGLAVLFAIACGLLAWWQLSRREETLREIARVTANYDSAAVPLTAALPTLNAFADGQKWLPVVMQGNYLVDQQVLVRNRPRNGQPGFEVLTPLLLADGSVFIVDRGWLPPGSAQDVPDSVPAPPAGTVQVVARLRAGEPSIPGRSAPAGQVATVQLPDLAARLGKPSYTGAYGLLATESPAAATRPAAAERPSLDEGPHLSYALQWVAFALIGFGGLFVAIRQEYRDRNSADPAERARAARRLRRAAARRPSDATIEDALLDGGTLRRG